MSASNKPPVSLDGLIQSKGAPRPSEVPQRGEAPAPASPAKAIADSAPRQHLPRLVPRRMPSHEPSRLPSGCPNLATSGFAGSRSSVTPATKR